MSNPITHQTLNSSFVTHGGHDGEATGEVKISDKTYRIHGITPDAWAEFMGAESLGKHFNSVIKTGHTVERVEE